MPVQLTTTMPTDVDYGKVIGRFILAVADASDPDRLPDAIPTVGDVTFTPARPIVKANVPVPTTIVRTQVRCTVNANGELIDPQGEVGVWLMAGIYKVNYNLAGTTVPSHDIEVLASHTDTIPLDLTNAVPSGGKSVTVSDYADLSSQIAKKADQLDLISLSVDLETKADQSVVAALTTAVATKADQAVVDGLSIDVQAISADVAIKADQSVVDGLSTDVQAISADVAAKASQTSVTTLAGRVSTLEANVPPVPVQSTIAYDTDGTPYLMTMDGSVTVVDGSDPSLTPTESTIAYDVDGTPYLVGTPDETVDGGTVNSIATDIVDGGTP